MSDGISFVADSKRQPFLLLCSMFRPLLSKNFVRLTRVVDIHERYKITQPCVVYRIPISHQFYIKP